MNSVTMPFGIPNTISLGQNSHQAVVDTQLVQIKSELSEARADAESLGEDLIQAGVPWVEGSSLPE